MYLIRSGEDNKEAVEIDVKVKWRRRDKWRRVVENRLDWFYI